MTFRTDYDIVLDPPSWDPELTFPEGHFNAPESTTVIIQVHIIPRF
jgi:hypothetical protein